MKHTDWPTWVWRDIVYATGETEDSLRQKLKAGTVKLPKTKTGRTIATIWDVAIIATARHLSKLGFENHAAYELAKVAVEKTYDRMLKRKDTTFNRASGEKQTVVFLIATRSDLLFDPSGGVRFITVDPNEIDAGRKELMLVASNPHNVIVPLASIVHQAFYRLPYLTDDIGAWLRAHGENIRSVGGET